MPRLRALLLAVRKPVPGVRPGVDPGDHDDAVHDDVRARPGRDREHAASGGGVVSKRIYRLLYLVCDWLDKPLWTPRRRRKEPSS